MNNDLLLRKNFSEPGVKSLFLATDPATEKEERLRTLALFNNTRVKFPTDKTIVDLFEDQVTKTPAGTAVIFDDQTHTYQELNTRDNQLAHHLRSQGVVDETLVPICIERGPEMLIGILAILKAGGAYVPMDPEYPLERIQYMLENTDASVAISSKTARAKLLSREDIQIVDMKDPLILDQPTENLSVSIIPEQLAYIIYTSGSAGKPKLFHRSNDGLGKIRHRAYRSTCN